MIEINQLQKNFGEKKAVDIEKYSIYQGDMLGLVGNNGAGKTTLFRLILDLLQADLGNVTINDIDVSKNEDWKQFTGAFIDDGFLIDYLTPEEYFYFIGKMYGLKKEEVDERLLPFERFMSNEVLGQKKFIRNFSAGNKQKIGIISAMLHHPQLLILDEPFNFLDPSSQSIIKHLLKKYNEDHHATVIISSHNLNHTVDVCPRIALMENGVIIRDIQNENNSAEKELEDYFNVRVEEEIEEEKMEMTAQETAIQEVPVQETPVQETRERGTSMKKYLSYIVALIGLTFSLSSCHTSAPRLDYKALAKASVRMGIDINKEDNHKLYIASAEWIGVPYRAGGDNKRGTDCSGLVSQLYKQVYNIRLSRSTDEQLKESNKVSRRNLREGDLVFFTSRASKKRVAHVGIYLKNGKFIHASTSKGVIVSSLNEQYYTQYWLRGGRVK